MLADLATHSEAPAHFIGQIMDDADRIASEAHGEDNASTAAARNALRNFNHAMLDHVKKISSAPGRG